jgi:riboflavin kinase/FMN adenylyltransferase
MKQTACALGFFDGVHKAHSHILSSCSAYAKENNLKSCALTFNISPVEFFGGEVEYLTDNKQKEKLILSLGIDSVIYLKADKETLSLSPEAFVKNILVDTLHASALFCGYNYSFGKNALGKADELKRLCEPYNIKVFVFDEMDVDSVSVSSSEIRKLLREGNVEKANRLLTHPFEVSGVVDYGKKLGRTIGFPTANIYPPSTFPRLPRGVYATKTIIDGKEYISVTNVGVNPTVGDESLRIETHISDFDETLYNREICVRFFKYLRAEKKFASVEELCRQISSDKKFTEEYFEKNI